MGGISDEELLEKDLYEILGVSQSSSEDEIRNAYKKKARRLHPGNIPKNICEYFLKVFSKFFPGFFEPLKKIQISGNFFYRWPKTAQKPKFSMVFIVFV